MRNFYKKKIYENFGKSLAIFGNSSKVFSNAFMIFFKFSENLRKSSEVFGNLHLYMNNHGILRYF